MKYFQHYNPGQGKYGVAVVSADPEGRESAVEFSELYQKTLNDLDTLIDLDKHILTKRKTAIAKLISSITRKMQRNDQSWRADFIYLMVFTRNLKTIEGYDKSMLAKFRRELQKQRSSTSFHGIRFEIECAGSLIRRKSKVTKRESPDFSITFENSTIYIESCSTLIESRNERGHLYKLESSINKKNQKSYANKDTALFVDFTGPMHHELNLWREGKQQELSFETIVNNEKIKYGAIFVFTKHLDSELKNYRSGISMNILPGCSEILKKFLEEKYPREPFSQKNPFIPLLDPTNKSTIT